MTDYMVEGLAKKRAEVAGEIERVHLLLGKLVQDLGHIDATLGIVAPDLVLEAIKPKVFQTPEDWSKHGQMSRVVLSILRTATRPITTREIAAQMVMERGLPATDKVLKTMTKRVSTCLNIRRERGQAVSQPGPGFHQLWEIVR
jgi:hypothetical protein